MKLADDAGLLRSWDYEKNNIIGLNPETLQSKSNKKAWWKCPQGHSWQREIYRQNEKRTCPYCCNKQVLVGYNDLCTLFPEIAKEWDHEKNLGKDINSYVKGSSQRIWWICSKCRHSWKTSIRARTLRGSGCPQCAKKQRVKTKNETIIQNRGCLNDPLLVKEWHPKNPDRPETFTRSSNKTVWWRCSKCQHEWRAKISNRSILGRGCPCCANKAVVPGKNDLATTHPDLSKEWHPTKNGTLHPNQVQAGSARKVWWLCPKGHEYRASLLHRGHGTGCPECNSGRQTSFAEQAIFYYVKKIFPDAKNRVKGLIGRRMELDIYIPSQKTAIEYDGEYWHQDEDLEKESFKYNECQRQGIKLIRIREAKFTDCTSHTADELLHMEGNFENKDNLSKLIRYLLDRLDPRSNFLTRTRFSFHSPVDINVKRDEFKILKYMQKLKTDSLADLYPALAAEWNFEKNGTLTPAMVKPGSSQKVWWRCKVCNYEWKTDIGHRTKGNTGCPTCSRKHQQENPPGRLKIYQYSLDGIFIREWNSIAEAGRVLRINSANISMVAKHQGGRKQAGGYRWEYTRIDSTAKIQPALFNLSK